VNEIRKPGRAEKLLRFVLAFLFTALLGFGAFLHSGERSATGASVRLGVGCLLVPALCGGLAVRYGDRFWEKVSNVLRLRSLR
jgi:hypothetical protein